MKKNQFINIFLLVICLFSFATVAKANAYDIKTPFYIARNVEGTQVGGGSGGSKTTTSASDTEIDLCQNPGVVKSFQVVGWGLFIIKIVAPLVLIVLGIIDIGKAIMASDDKAIQAGVSTLVKRAIAAVVIFFIPTIINLVFKLVNNSEEAKQKYSCLSTCLTSPGSCKVPDSKLFN